MRATYRTMNSIGRAPARLVRDHADRARRVASLAAVRGRCTEREDDARARRDVPDGDGGEGGRGAGVDKRGER
jgi:hypothetical protein